MISSKFHKLRDATIQFSKILEPIHGEIFIRLRRAENHIEMGNQRIKNEWLLTFECLQSGVEKLNKMIQLEYSFKKQISVFSTDDYLSKITEIHPYLTELIIRSDIALKLVPSSKKGRPFKIYTTFLVKNLIKIYEKGTGKKASISFDNHKERFYSPFLEFVKNITDEIQLTEAWESIVHHTLHVNRYI